MRLTSIVGWLGCGIVAVSVSAGMAAEQAQLEGEPLYGFGAQTRGGAGGRTAEVTTLAASGRGSIAEALAAKGPRTIVFKVGGVVDLAGRSLKISSPYVTVAGETAPSPGITFIRGGIGVSTHDVIIRHIRVRSGDNGRGKKSGWEVDALSTTGAWNVVVDHCSISWATDENLSASGDRFNGDGESEWRQNTSHDVTFSHSIIAEGLNQATHKKGGHSKGSLIHDNTSRIAIIGNLYVSNVDRNPLFKGGAEGVVVNNFIYNPGSKAMHYRLVASEWEGHRFVAGKMAVVGNVLQYGPDTRPDTPLLSYDGDGPLELYTDDNLAFDREGKAVAIVAQTRGKPEDLRRLKRPPLWPEGLKVDAAAAVRSGVLKTAGARPGDRDPVDQRLIAEILQGRGRIIDSQDEVGGYKAAGR